MGKTTKRVAFLATGDEITQGDVFNSNTPWFAQQLVAAGIEPGVHMSVADDETALVEAIRYLLRDHQALITVGGLGPTSDDRTRFALAKALQTELVFDEPTWQAISRMLEAKKLSVTPTNRVQCWFPEAAQIIPNPNGTAFACYLQHQQQTIFMLPGPPNECRPMFNRIVIDKLLALKYQEIKFKAHWLLLGVSESNIAQQLDPLAENSGCYIGYRIDYPYLEVKAHAKHQQKLELLSEQLTNCVADTLISRDNQKASQQLYQYLLTAGVKLVINDQATLGKLQSLLTSPETQMKLQFCGKATATSEYQIDIQGLREYWQQGQLTKQNYDLDIHIQHNTEKTHYRQSIPSRGKRSVNYACEIISLYILQYFNKLEYKPNLISKKLK